MKHLTSPLTTLRIHDHNCHQAGVPSRLVPLPRLAPLARAPHHLAELHLLGLGLVMEGDDNARLDLLAGASALQEEVGRHPAGNCVHGASMERMKALVSGDPAVVLHLRDRNQVRRHDAASHGHASLGATQ